MGSSILARTPLYSCIIQMLSLLFCVYVDDLIITGNSKSFVVDFIQAISQKFSLKDLGHLHYFLGVEVPTIDGLFLFQQKYIQDLLERHHLASVKDYVNHNQAYSK